MPEKELLETILAAQVLTLAKELKNEKTAKGVFTTSDFIDDAVREIRQKKTTVLELLRRTA